MIITKFSIGGWARIGISNGILLVSYQEIDPGEMTNLVSAYPEKADELKAQFDQWMERLQKIPATELSSIIRLGVNIFIVNFPSCW